MEENLKKRYENLKEIFLDNCSEERKEEFKKLIEFAETKTDYLTAPASTKFHLNRENGLLEHSVNVAENLIKLRNLLDKSIPLDSCVLVGLFHDFGKTGINNKPYYVPGVPTPKQKKFGYPASDKYSINPDLKGKWEHCEISIILLRPLIKMYEDELEAVRYHDGQYIELNKSYAHHECKLALLLHWADLWSVQSEPVIEY